MKNLRWGVAVGLMFLASLLCVVGLVKATTATTYYTTGGQCARAVLNCNVVEVLDHEPVSFGFPLANWSPQSGQFTNGWVVIDGVNYSISGTFPFNPGVTIGSTPMPPQNVILNGTTNNGDVTISQTVLAIYNKSRTRYGIKNVGWFFYPQGGSVTVR